MLGLDVPLRKRNWSAHRKFNSPKFNLSHAPARRRGQYKPRPK
jgi:hypothetical protein